MRSWLSKAGPHRSITDAWTLSRFADRKERKDPVPAHRRDGRERAGAVPVKAAEVFGVFVGEEVDPHDGVCARERRAGKWGGGGAVGVNSREVDAHEGGADDAADGEGFDLYKA